MTEVSVSIGVRSALGAAEEGIGYTDVLKSNLVMYKNSVFRLSLIIYTLAVSGIILYRLIKRSSVLSARQIPMYLCVIAIPFAWYYVTSEHAQVHAFYTYKDLTVAVFAYCSGLASILGVNRIKSDP